MYHKEMGISDAADSLDCENETEELLYQCVKVVVEPLVLVYTVKFPTNAARASSLRGCVSVDVLPLRLEDKIYYTEIRWHAN